MTLSFTFIQAQKAHGNAEIRQRIGFPVYQENGL